MERIFVSMDEVRECLRDVFSAPPTLAELRQLAKEDAEMKTRTGHAPQLAHTRKLAQEAWEMQQEPK